ncbi:small proline-rich protein 3 [Eublepharis macularius]|uniref:Small proline-rich protein 3 n=1 Tax=Eublepharis macularius TaxID=481883 RepID=A0AA97LEU5_EUBMA|nr:small proline-rich protein 3 [Eublepharis macularius]
MTYYRQRHPMSLPFVKKGPTYYGPRYIPLYGSKSPLSVRIPVYEEGPRAPLRPPPCTTTRYQPRRVSVCPEPTTTKYPEVNLTRKLARASLRCPRSCATYSGMTKGRYGTITKMPEPYANKVPLPRMTKGPVIYSTKPPQPYVTKDPLPTVIKDPVIYPTSKPQPCETKVPLPRMTKGPVIYVTKDSQPYINNSTQIRTAKGMLSRAAKHTLAQVKKGTTRGPRLLSTKVPHLGVMKPSRLWLSKVSQSQPCLTTGSQPNLAKGSRVHLTKGSQPNLAKGSRVHLTKSSQPNLIHTGTFSSPKKLAKNVKISTTGKKYCSATKWF